MTSSSWGRLLGACVIACAASPGVRALPVVRKTPGGPHVTGSSGSYSVPAGQAIEWSVRVCNDTAAPITADVMDYLHSGECGGHAVQELACPPVATGDGAVAACDDAANPPISAPALDVRGIPLAPNQCADVIFRTTVDLLAPGGTQACNIIVYATTAGTPDASGQSSPPTGSGCSCVTVERPLPTQMSLYLRMAVDVPPFVAGDSASTVRFEIEGVNETPREALGRLVVPIPTGLQAAEVLTCPPGATCGVTGANELEIRDLEVPEGGSFSAAFRLRGACSGLAESRICAQGWLEPLEDPANRILTDDASSPGLTSTCFKPALPDLVLRKSWRFTDRDADGVPSTGDRVRFLIEAWNRGLAPAREVTVRDNLPIGFDRAESGAEAVEVDPSGTYAAGRASWAWPDLGPGSVATAWVETTMQVDAPSPNRAQLSTRVITDCGSSTILSDDPLTPAAGDPTTVSATPPSAPLLEKSFTFDDSNGDGLPSAGEAATFRILAINTGPATAAAVSVTDALPACLGDLSAVTIVPAGAGTNSSTPRLLDVRSVGGADGLKPDESVTITFASRIADPACCNQASIAWSGGSGLSRDPRGFEVAEPTCLLASARSVRLTKDVRLLDADGDGVPTPGDRLRYELIAINDGVHVPDLIVTDEIPMGLAVDPATITVTAPIPAVPSFAPAPAGLHGAGRLHVEPLDLQAGEAATIAFEVLVLSTAATATCNEASLRIGSMSWPRGSDDVSGGGPTCVSVELPTEPVVTVDLAASGELTTACALPGEEVTLTVSVAVGGSTATGVVAAIDRIAGLDVIDAGGGTPGPGEITWDLGAMTVGSTASRSIRATRPCVLATDSSAGARATSTNAATATAPEVAFVSTSPDVAGALTLTHDDVNADGVLDPGETVLASLQLTAAAGCDVTWVTGELGLAASLIVVEARDGAVLVGSQLSWPAAPLAAGASATFEVVLGLDPAAQNCARPRVTPGAAWPISPATACTEEGTWAAAAASLPPGPCVGGGLDLLREDAISDLASASAELPALLDRNGADDSCTPGVVTRVDPTRVVATGVGALLDPGVVVPGDALPVGPGSPGQLVFYEVSGSCDTIFACKIDDDGSAANGRESLRIGIRPCLP